MVAKCGTQNREVLVATVMTKFAEYPAEKLNDVFLTLQMVMHEVILCNGNNDYKLKHMNKSQLKRNGELPISITASQTVLDAIP